VVAYDLLFYDSPDRLYSSKHFGLYNDGWDRAEIYG